MADPGAIGYRLAVERTAVEVHAALSAEGCRPLLLKGASLAQWLYDDPIDREFTDVDVLVDPGRAEAARAALGTLGLTHRDIDPEPLPGGETWMRPGAPPPVDLHLAIPGVGLDPAAAFAKLDPHRTELRLEAGVVEALSGPALALTLVLHARHHGAAVDRGGEEVGLMLSRADSGLLTAMAELARELDCADQAGVGLALAPGGAAIAARFGLPVAPGSRDRLYSAEPPPLAAGLERVISGEVPEGRVRSLLRRSLPRPAMLRARFPRLARTPPGLAIAVVLWPFWLLARTPGALLAVARARRRQGQPRA